MPELDETLLWIYPDIRPRFRRLAEDVRTALGAKIRITEGLRSYADQALRYARGRTAPGPKVTNARPGLSWHQYGLAFDICFAGADPYLERLLPDASRAMWGRFGAIARGCGFVWGGDFKLLADKPHCQLSFGLTIQEALELFEFNGIAAVWHWIDQHSGHDTSLLWPDELRKKLVQI